MSRDRSLEEFFATDEATESGGDGESDRDEEPDRDRSDREAVEPAASTYRWTPDEAPCPRCSAAGGRRWRDGDQFVCADCKEW